MKVIAFIFMLSFSLVCARAQQTITGKVVDEKNTALEFVNIALFTQQDSTFIAGTITDIQGNFQLESPTSKTCIMRVSCIGYKTIYQITNGNNQTIKLENDAHMLGEVVVKASRPVTRIKADALITQVEGSILAQAGTAKDMLDYIPTVSSQGGLNVFGRGTPIVYINGRLMRDASELEQLSSNNIKSVEVVTNPGARYAANVKAVIRIHTKKAVGDGISFNNTTTARHNKKWSLSEQINLNYRQGDLDIFGMVYYGDSYSWQKSNSIQNGHLDKLWQQEFHISEEGRTRIFTTDIGMNYVINAKHSLGFRYRFSRRPNDDSDGSIDSDITQDGTPFETTQSIFSSFSQSTRNTVSLYYNGNVKDWNIDFNTDLLWTDNKEAVLTQEDINPVNGVSSSRDVNSLNKIKNNLYAAKLIFSRELLGGSFAIGGEYSYTNRTNDYRNPEGIMRNDASEIKEGNASAFAEYNRKFGNTTVQAGLRYENVFSITINRVYTREK